MNPLPLVGAELRRSWAGALALGLIIAVAIALGVAVTAQERALRQGSARAADDFDILVGAPGSQAQLALTAVYLQEAALGLMGPQTLDDVARRNGIAWMAPIAFGDSYRGMPIVGTTEAFVTRGGKRTLSEGRLFGREGEAVVGAAVPLRIGDRFTPVHGHSREDGRRLPGEAQHDGHEVTVVGRMEPSGTPYDRAILIPIESVWEAHGLATGHPDGDDRIGPPWPMATGEIPVIVVKAASVGDAYRLRAAFRNDRTMAIFPAEVLVSLYATLGDVRDLMRAMAIVCQVLVLISVLVCVMAIAAGRRRDIAVLRALGAPRRFVFATVWLGVALLVLGGTAGGLILGTAGTTLASAALSTRLGFTITGTVGLEEFALCALACVAGLVLALVPAMAAYRTSTATALASP